MVKPNFLYKLKTLTVTLKKSKYFFYYFSITLWLLSSNMPKIKAIGPPDNRNLKNRSTKLTENRKNRKPNLSNVSTVWKRPIQKTKKQTTINHP